MKYPLLIFLIFCITSLYGLVGMEWQSILIGILTGYMLGVMFE